MIPMYQRIKQQQLNYRKIRDAIGTSILTTLLGEFDRIIVKKENTVILPTDEVVFKIIAKFIENIKQTQEIEFSESRTVELAILEELLTYQPAKVNEEDLRNIIVKFMESNPGSGLKEVMPFLKKELGNTFDGKLASSIVRSELDKVSE